MTEPAYERLSALDNIFLLVENPKAYMHVGATHTFEAGPLKKPDGGIDADLIKSALEANLHRIPRYRQKLAYLSMENRPAWVDDDCFNIDYHIRHTSLPIPGNDSQLKELSALTFVRSSSRRPLTFFLIWLKSR